MNSLQLLIKADPNPSRVGIFAQADVNLVKVPRNIAGKMKVLRMEAKKTLKMTDEAPEDLAQQMAACIALVANDRDREAFMRIYSHFAPRVKSFLVGRGLNQATADDVLQEAMLAVWEKAHSYSPEKAALSTWIFTIARYKYIDRLRKDGRQKTESDEPDLRPSDSLETDGEVLQKQRQDAVQQAIAQLPEDQQSVIFLSFIKGLAHSEIAEQLGLPLGTVKSRIRRSFEQLREHLGEVK